MLVEKYNKKTNEYECYDDGAKWIALTGYGKTKEEARIDYFKINIVKHPVPVILTGI